MKACLKISKQQEFRHILKHGKKHANNLFRARVVDNSLNYSRLGIIISSKVVRLAVHRNRFKRLIKQLFVSQQNFKKNVDVVIIVLRISTWRIQDIEASLVNLWEDCGLI